MTAMRTVTIEVFSDFTRVTTPDSEEIFDGSKPGWAFIEAMEYLQEKYHNDCQKCLAEIDKSSDHARGGSGLCEDCWNAR